MIQLKDAVFLEVASPVAGAAADCGRTGLASVMVRDAAGAEVPASKYTATAGELAAGVIHWADPLSLAGHPAPWTVIHSKPLLALPAGLLWANRFDWNGGLSQTVTPTTGGAIVIQSYQMLAGRTIRLEQPSPDVALMEYADVQVLDGLASTDGTRYVLRLDGADYLVQFERPPFAAKPALGFSRFLPGERWQVSPISFITV